METLSKSTSDSKLNPFAQPFSPSRFSHNLSVDDLQLPTTADLGELLAIHDQDPAEHNGPAPLAEHQDIFSSMGSSPSGRLNIFFRASGTILSYPKKQKRAYWEDCPF